MKHAIILLTTIILAYAFICGASAESALSLKEAVNEALEHNASLKSTKAEVLGSKANERGAGTLTNPEITVTPGITGSAGSDEVLSVVQPLEVNGQRKIRSRIAQAETRALEANSKSVERDLIRSVKHAYWDIVQIQSIVDLNTENVKLADSLYKSAIRQRDVGTAPGSQVIKTQVELTLAQQDLSQTESDLLQAKAVLNTLLARSPDAPMDVSDTLIYELLTFDTSTLPAPNEANRPELVESQAILDVRKGEISAAKARRRPDLAIQLRQTSFGGEGGLGLGITLPLLDWGSVKADRQRAKAAADAQEQRIESMKTSIALDVDSALRDIKKSASLITKYKDGVLSQSEQLFDMAQKGFAAGATGYLDVLEAQRTLRNTKADYYTELSNYQKALAQLEWALGVDINMLDSKETK
ncbi:MAG: TolC family protein [Armatimonadota bacterium]